MSLHLNSMYKSLIHLFFPLYHCFVLDFSYPTFINLSSVKCQPHSKNTEQTGIDILENVATLRKHMPNRLPE